MIHFWICLCGYGQVVGSPYLWRCHFNIFQRQQTHQNGFIFGFAKKNMGMSENPPIIAIIAMDNDH